MATGMTPDGQPMMTADANGNPMPATPPVDPNLAMEMQQLAYGMYPPEMSDFSETDS